MKDVNGLEAGEAAGCSAGNCQGLLVYYKCFLGEMKKGIGKNNFGFGI